MRRTVRIVFITIYTTFVNTVSTMYFLDDWPNMPDGRDLDDQNLFTLVYNDSSRQVGYKPTHSGNRGEPSCAMIFRTFFKGRQ